MHPSAICFHWRDTKIETLGGIGRGQFLLGVQPLDVDQLVEVPSPLVPQGEAGPAF